MAIPGFFLPSDHYGRPADFLTEVVLLARSKKMSDRRSRIGCDQASTHLPTTCALRAYNPLGCRRVHGQRLRTKSAGHAGDPCVT